jgi:hypothetical protein
MAREKGKFVRVSVDFTKEEYRKVKDEVTKRRCFIGAFVKDCTMDVLADPLHAVQRIPRRTYG